MSDATTRPRDEAVLHVGIEVGDRQWKLASTIGLGQVPRVRTIAAGDVESLLGEVARAKSRFGLAPESPVFSCYEAGRAGFWPHRVLNAVGIANVTVDSSSIEVNRRKRRAKTDRLDGTKLSRMLVRYHDGEKKLWGVVRVPTLEEEDLRHLHRELITCRQDRTACSNRIKSLLMTHGIKRDTIAGLPTWISEVHGWDGSPLPPGLLRRIHFEWQKIELLNRQIQLLHKERRRLLRKCPREAMDMVRRLLRLKGIGIETAWLLTMEFFAWRQFRNVRELAALAGLAPTPHLSGELSRELGITKSGNRLVRWILVEAAWSWLKHQPQSELAQWYERRFGGGGPRQRKIGIVAVARKLLCALWKYLDQGLLPAGAALKS